MHRMYVHMIQSQNLIHNHNTSHAYDMSIVFVQLFTSSHQGEHIVDYVIKMIALVDNVPNGKIRYKFHKREDTYKRSQA